MTTTLENVRQSIAEAFPFEVCKLPLLGPDRERTPHYGLFRSDNSECVGNACRRGYTPHTLDDVQALAEAASAGFDASHCGITCSWDGGHHVIIGPTDEHRRAIYGTADNIFPRFILQAGYDGRAFTASLGLFRDACSNLQWIRTAGQSHSVSLRHTRQLRDRMPGLIETFRGLAARWDGVVSTVERMQAAELDFREFVAAVYPMPEDASRRTVGSYQRRAESIVGRLMRERQRTGRPLGSAHTATAWEAFNAIQGYVQHDKSRKGRLSVAQRAIKALTDADVSRAMELALAV
ncbi:DUF945 domain-containing protein [Aeoliella sp. ICT_H6.2]|uniref:DUF945 domain-containing protein n=1 Tax=Aeoliella straminimaris TaxID=2954799 RepID=A0A9X2FCA1_9BACT|nr:DUF932 domain-containing protein [Aeoliella straminimaris]MCO6043341.1 DUF945 domain-containing protein [Aeoliella straminimaris]